MLYVGKPGILNRGNADSVVFVRGKIAGRQIKQVETPYGQIGECRHTPSSEWKLVENRKQTDCMIPGIRKWACPKCGRIMGVDVVGEIEKHDWEEHYTVPPTCTAPGYFYLECEKCGKLTEEQPDFEPLGHDWEYSNLTKEPTCEESGHGDMRCTRCGTFLQNQEIPPLGHDWKIGFTIRPATCTEPGEYEKICKRCGAKTTDEIPPENHAFLDMKHKRIKEGRYNMETGECIEPTIVEIPCLKCGKVAERLVYDKTYISNRCFTLSSSRPRCNLSHS